MSARTNLVDGRFELLERLPDQGHGETWRARDTLLRDRLVALKFTRDGVNPNDAAFAATLRRLKGFRHGAVLALLHHGVADGRVYLVYELFEGPSLATGLAQTWREGALLPRAMLERLVEKLGEAVTQAHALSPPLVHGGLDAACVLLQRSSPTHFDLRVTDFGVAALTGAVAGVGSTEVAADVVGLGRVMRALCAAPAGVGQAPPPAGQDWRREDVPDELWAVVERATATRPGERFGDVDTLMQAVEAAWRCPVKGAATKPRGLGGAHAESSEVAPNEAADTLAGPTEVAWTRKPGAEATGHAVETDTVVTTRARSPERAGEAAAAWGSAESETLVDGATVLAVPKRAGPGGWSGDAVDPTIDGTMLAVPRGAGYVPAEGDTVFEMPRGGGVAVAEPIAETVMVSAAERPRSPWDAPGAGIEKTELVGWGAAGGVAPGRPPVAGPMGAPWGMGARVPPPSAQPAARANVAAIVAAVVVGLILAVIAWFVMTR